MSSALLNGSLVTAILSDFKSCPETLMGIPDESIEYLSYSVDRAFDIVFPFAILPIWWLNSSGWAPKGSSVSIAACDLLSISVTVTESDSEFYS